MSGELTEGDCMATLKKEVAIAMLAGGPIKNVTENDIMIALSSGPKTLSVLQKWIDELSGEYIAP